MPRRLHVVPLVACLLLISLSISAQRTPRRVFVSAVSADGKPVLDLTAAEFSVTENDVKRDVTRAALGTAPMRIVLLVDSSSAVERLLTPMRAGLNSFLETLPGQHEITFITTGGQLRIRVPTTADRPKLISAAKSFASDGGANSFVDTLLESDRRFLRNAPTQWPVVVLLMTDSGGLAGTRIEEYNGFMNDFLARGGTAHGIVVHPSGNAGVMTEVAMNLIQNTGGIYESMNTANILPERMNALAARIGADHQAMANRYEVEYTSDGKVQQPRVHVGVTRPGVSLQMSPRRPF
jgi:hypothetical protein